MDTTAIFDAVTASLPSDAGRAVLSRGRESIDRVICTGIEQARTQDDMGRLIAIDCTARYLVADEMSPPIRIGDKLELTLQGQNEPQRVRVTGRFPIGSMIRLVLQAEFE